ncbi:uncharacterized protein LTR77_009991 [Saxophila tyrrhenica]|uniref:F-box domain-containing protein n=1 Tax=Saxophila tyrrhenica TaxID=1690608 RepID=A0AAV9NXH3_9PEZI|nr:hypothetical protein LTR77_009991 [Saxophila tyrrhenica]
MADPAEENQGATGFLQMPVEITERIAKFCDIGDLLTLRLVNREVESKIIRAYTEAHFVQPAFLLSQERSLQALQQIVGHPQFGKAIKGLYFSTAELPDFDDWERYKMPISSQLSLSEQYKCDAREQMYRLLYERQKEFSGSDRAIDLLTRIFSVLVMSHDGQLGFFVMNTTNSFYSVCESAIEDATGETLTETLHPEKPLKPIVQALHRSGLSIHTLGVEYRDWVGFLQSLASSEALDHAKGVFANLKRFELERLHEDGDEEMVFMLRRTPARVKVFAAAQALERAELSTSWSHYERGQTGEASNIAAMFPAPVYPALSYLQLVGLVLYFEALVHFISQNETLQNIVIRRSHFLDEFNQHPPPNEISQHDQALVALLRETAGQRDYRLNKCTVREWEEDMTLWT